MSSIMMSTEEIRELKKMGSDPMLELGMALRPEHSECFKSKVVTHGIRERILFKEHEDAEK